MYALVVERGSARVPLIKVYTASIINLFKGIVSCPSRDLTSFAPIVANLLVLREPNLRWVLRLVWENVTPARLACIVVRLLPL